MGGILRWGVRVSKIKIAGGKNSQERGSQALTKTGGAENNHHGMDCRGCSCGNEGHVAVAPPDVPGTIVRDHSSQHGLCEIFFALCASLPKLN